MSICEPALNNEAQFFATCPRGLEAVLAREVTALGAAKVSAVDGGVHFAGLFTLGYAANLHSRVASRVLWRVAQARYRATGTDQDIYDATHRLDWPKWFNVEHTLRVNVSAIKAPVKSLDFITLRIKDAICDVFRARGGKRPSIDTHAPDVRVHAFLTATDLTLYLDTSGEPLFKRGYRREAGEAPLRENLAAGMLALSGWTPGVPLLDPLCGSGTVLCEAAMMAANRAPGGGRAFGFEKLTNFNAGAWKALRDAAVAKENNSMKSNIYGSDLRGDAIQLTRANLVELGLEASVALKQANVFEMPPPAPSGIIVTNPPYGVRMEDRNDLAAFYPKLGDALKKRFSGWTAYILSSDMQLAKGIGLAASKRTPLFNGALECRLFEYKLVSGSMRRVKPAPAVAPD
ncbi:MAG TPA: class I SAM-dependent RNA methyltransferase [Burkholderiales bacterium]|nr:class I SAM-dependent RNA methyltransferase [Burkholderiales bacterium]